MRIEELYLAGFGRFTNKRIILQDGLNLLYGENEAGKTTLQHFIVGMLYGFFVPTARRKTYTDDYMRFMPWNSDATYGGSMICSKDGHRYRIQRVFQKERESVLIFDADTGEDISEQFPYDPVTRVRDPGTVLTGVSRTVYCNTANVAQLETSTQEGFSTAWEDQILSLTETADSSLSLQSVCDILDHKAEAIGSPKRRKSPYGMAVERLQQLEQELNEVLASEQERLQLRQRIVRLEQQKAALEEQMQQEELLKYKEQYKKAKVISQRIHYVENVLAQAAPAVDPDELQQKIGACQQAKQNLHRQEQNFTKWDERLKEINRRYLAQPIRMQDVNALDRCLLLAKNSVDSKETQELREQLQQKQQEFINIPTISSNDAWEALLEYDSWQEDIDNPRMSKKWIVLALGLLLIALGVIMGWKLEPFFYAAAGIGAILLVCSFFISSRHREVDEAEEEQERILKQYNMESYEQLKAYCDGIQNQEEHRMELMNEIQLLALRLKKVSDEMPRRKEELDRCAARFTKDPNAKWSQEMEAQVKYARQLCLEFADLSTRREEDFKQLKQLRQELAAMEQDLADTSRRMGQEDFSEDSLQQLRQLRREREQASVELELQQKLLEECLDGMSLEELEGKAQPSSFSADLSVQDSDYKAIVEELAQLQGKLTTMEQFQRPIGEIQEEQLALQEQCRRYQNTLDALVLAKDRMVKVSSSIRRDWSPMLAQRLSQVVYRLTDGKYSKLLLSRDLHIRLEEPKTGQLVPVTALSRGTMDLIYLALRMELLQLLSKDSILPMVLDDSFVQLDDGRCANLLHYLAYNRQGQVLLLTCHKREEAMLKALKVPYHRIVME